MVVNRSPIIVTGIQRSGSTMIAKILQEAGVFTGITGSTIENKRIRRILDGIYLNNGVDPLGQYPLPDGKSWLHYPSNLENRINGVLNKEGYTDAHKWLMKGHRFGQTWQIWKALYPNAKWVIVRRRTPDVIDSCMKTAYMYKYNDPKVLKEIKSDLTTHDGWLWWIRRNENYLNSLIHSDTDYMVVWPERMARNDYSQIKHLHGWLNIPFEENRIRELITPMMENSKQRK